MNDPHHNVVKTTEMPVTMETTLQYLAWSEGKFFERLYELPESLYGASYGNPEWTVAKMAWHIASGATWYEFCLTGTMHERPEIPTSRDELMTVGSYLRQRTATIVDEGRYDDALLHVVTDEEEFDVARSILLTQAVLHSIEHRAQIAAAVESRGHNLADLGEIDGWAFAEERNR
ncbi:MAG: hypothetical protein KJS64_05000 [Acidobacteria bacterium]|nr:hypothetical protein [Acidobacteriota bacterium]